MAQALHHRLELPSSPLTRLTCLRHTLPTPFQEAETAISSLMAVPFFITTRFFTNDEYYMYYELGPNFPSDIQSIQVDTLLGDEDRGERRK